MKINIDTQTETRLKEIAACGNGSPEALAAEILAQQIQDDAHARYWRERIEDQARNKNMQKNGGIPHHVMMNWVEDLAAEKDE